MVKKRNANVLTTFILDNIPLNSTIISDGWRGYFNLGNLGYNHRFINHSVEFVDSNDSDLHKNNIERTLRSLREFMPFNVKESNIKEWVEL